ncbi:RDD family protein [Empedobacter sp. UBA7248]|uniref:RDD family protein n=1 Tax=Empedobacter sp. UBA7248 TaxID=1946448 RepID=UPI0025C2B1CD|nr:RDD family protein [Empedobacter sp. UBA7248]
MKSNKYIFQRLIAGFIDYAVFIIIAALYIYKFGTLVNDGSYNVNGINTLPIFIFWFIYFIVIEVILHGTLGHLILNLQPVNAKTEKPISFSQSFIRHLFDPIDYFIFGGLIGILIINNSKESQRLGDIVANTKMIKK